MWDDDESVNFEASVEVKHAPPELTSDPITATISSIPATSTDDSVAIVDPPPPADVDCITLSDSPLLVTFGDDEDDDVRIIANVSPPQRYSTDSVAPAATNTSVNSAWLCAKKRFL